MSLQAPVGGWDGDGWWGMHRGMMGWGDGVDIGSSQAQPEDPDAPTLEVGASEFAFRPVRVEIEAGEAVNLRLTNLGDLPHDLSIAELGFRLVANAGEAATGRLEVDQPGEYRFLCTVPGHAQAGMVGTLVVEAADTSS
jgi:plastocyanin